MKYVEAVILYNDGWEDQLLVLTVSYIWQSKFNSHINTERSDGFFLRGSKKVRVRSTGRASSPNPLEVLWYVWVTFTWSTRPQRPINLRL